MFIFGLMISFLCGITLFVLKRIFQQSLIGTLQTEHKRKAPIITNGDDHVCAQIAQFF